MALIKNPPPVLRDANLEKAVLDGLDLCEADLVGCNFAQASLVSAQLGEADLSRCNFFYANMEGANLYRAKLADTSFYGANLRNTNLADSDLRAQTLGPADLRDACLISTFLWRRNIKGCKLQGAKLSEAQYEGIPLPKGTTIPEDVEDPIDWLDKLISNPRKPVNASPQLVD